MDQSTSQTPPSDLPAERPQTRRQRLILLAYSNQEWLQYYAELGLSNVPGILAKPLMHILKGGTKGEITGDTLWKLVPFAVRDMSDETFDRLYREVMTFLGEL